MDFLTKRGSSDLPDTENETGLLKEPGDHLSARVTDSLRKVIKYANRGGTNKYSATQYPNGTIVETKTTKKK